MTPNLAEEKIAEVLKKAKLKTNGQFLNNGWLILVPLLIIGIVVCALFFYFKSYLPLVIGVLIIFVGAMSSLYFFVQAKKIDQKNERILSQLGAELFKIYFENSAGWYPSNLDLRFDGFFPSQIFNNQCLHFSLGLEKVIWNIDEDVEERTAPLPSPRGGMAYQRYFVYVLKCALSSTSQKLNGLSDIYLFEGHASKNGEKFFESESIAFNERFCVEGWNQTEVYKLFTPKVIDNFINTEPNFLKAKRIEIRNGKAEISWRGPERLKSWIPDFFDFSKVRWTKANLKADILEKIRLDFDRYWEIQRMLLPLDLYEVH